MPSKKVIAVSAFAAAAAIAIAVIVIASSKGGDDAAKTYWTCPDGSAAGSKCVKAAAGQTSPHQGPTGKQDCDDTCGVPVTDKTYYQCGATAGKCVPIAGKGDPKYQGKAGKALCEKDCSGTPVYWDCTDKSTNECSKMPKGKTSGYEGATGKTECDKTCIAPPQVVAYCQNNLCVSGTTPGGAKTYPDIGTCNLSKECLAPQQCTCDTSDGACNECGRDGQPQCPSTAVTCAACKAVNGCVIPNIPCPANKGVDKWCPGGPGNMCDPMTGCQHCLKPCDAGWACVGTGCNEVCGDKLCGSGTVCNQPTKQCVKKNYSGIIHGSFVKVVATYHGGLMTLPLPGCWEATYFVGGDQTCVAPFKWQVYADPADQAAGRSLENFTMPFRLADGNGTSFFMTSSKQGGKCNAPNVPTEVTIGITHMAGTPLSLVKPTSMLGRVTVGTNAFKVHDKWIGIANMQAYATTKAGHKAQYPGLASSENKNTQITKWAFIKC